MSLYPFFVLKKQQVADLTDDSPVYGPQGLLNFDLALHSTIPAL